MFSNIQLASGSNCHKTRNNFGKININKFAKNLNKKIKNNKQIKRIKKIKKLNKNKNKFKIRKIKK